MAKATTKKPNPQTTHKSIRRSTKGERTPTRSSVQHVTGKKSKATPPPSAKTIPAASPSATFKPELERLQKIIAQMGICSRRAAEQLIYDGEVTLNGQTAKLGDKATLGKDSIKVQGKLLSGSTHKVYYLFYKPKKVIAMINDDEEGRPTIKNFVNKLIRERVFPVGRMDYNGEGAMILTNDGEFTQEILHSNKIVRRYHVKVDRHPTTEELARIARGGRLEGKSIHPLHVRMAHGYKRNALIELSFEGMNAIDLRKFFENKGFFVEKVARVGIGHLSAEKLAPGSFRSIPLSSIEALMTQPELAHKQIELLAKTKSKGVKTLRDPDSERAPKKRA